LANRYEKLVGNTLVFAIGSFSSKLLVLLMMRYYTGILAPAQYSVADRITTTANLLMPFVMLSINEAIIRFGMDRNENRSEVFTTGLKVVLAGFLVFLVVSPVMLLTDMLSPYIWLIAVFVLFGMLKSVTAQFVRAIGLVRLYVIDGFIATATTILFNILFLSVFSWGISGYVLATVASNLVSVVGLFLAAKLWRFVCFRRKNPRLRAEMLRYSIPLIPTTMFWWITNVSDRYIVTYFCGDAANGLYTVACKLPGLLTIVSSIFYQAWQISAVSEKDSRTATRFYSEVYGYFNTALFLAGSGLLMLLRPITSVLYAPDYYASWQYTPFLVMSEVFSSLVTFLGTFYMVKKKNATVPVAIATGAILNIVLNFLLIPKYGPLAAAFTTFISYLAAFAVRAIDVRRVVKIRMRILNTAGNLLLLMVQAWLMYQPATDSFWVGLGMFVLMVVVNIKPLLRLAFALFDRLMARRGGATA
jgi:O-antigen/teichoic acid export membrane protein